ncbi:hypothetical protein [Bacillus solitudinis]|uniref:hypothetical protein n=1 Tax=Bacillus solitudinis TaxID=2014074 RepID=UPI000C23371D|nr:hypothetical protein [Bacillus solitudinis]
MLHYQQLIYWNVFQQITKPRMVPSISVSKEEAVLWWKQLKVLAGQLFQAFRMSKYGEYELDGKPELILPYPHLKSLGSSKKLIKINDYIKSRSTAIYFFC